MTLTLAPIAVPNFSGASTPVTSYSDGTNNTPAHLLLDNTGALISPATSGNQTAGNASLAAIATNTTGAATAANQAAGNTSLATISTAVQAATPAGTNLIGKVGIDQTTPGETNLVALGANTTGGASTYSATGGTGNALLTNSPVAVKAAPGNLYGVNFVNSGNSVGSYVQLFDVAAGSVTLGTTPPKLSFWVPPFGALDRDFTGEEKIAFLTAITAAATTTPTGNTAPSTGILANIIYK